MGIYSDVALVMNAKGMECLNAQLEKLAFWPFTSLTLVLTSLKNFVSPSSQIQVSSAPPSV